MPGDAEGVIDFDVFLRVVAEHGYRGWLVIEAEQDPDRYNPFDYQSLGLNSLKGAACAAGLASAASGEWTASGSKDRT